MSAHTEAKLFASQILDDGRWGLVSINGQIIIGLNNHLTEANARRFAACWNALQGMPTEHLEQSEADFNEMALKLLDARKGELAARALLADVLKFAPALLRVAETPAADLLLSIRALLKVLP